MSDINNNSYNKCINQLHSRYSGRGVSVNAANEMRERTAKENAGPNAYFLVGRMSKSMVSDKYRNGEHNGQKYMTTGDFLKYYNNHKNPAPINVEVKRASDKTKEFKKPTTLQKRAIETKQNTAPRMSGVNPTKAQAVMRHDPKADTIVMPAKKTTNKILARIARLKDKWFPADEKNEKVTVYKKNVPVAALALIFSLSVAMTAILGSTVMASDARTDISDIKYEIECLEAEKAALEEELVKRDDLAMIREYAENELGMIRQDYISSVYVEVGEANSVNAENELPDAEMAALLSAMFGN